MEVGEKMVFPDDMEDVLGENKRKAISLRVFEYAKVFDRISGQVTIEKGEKLLFLEPSQELLDTVQAAIEVINLGKYFCPSVRQLSIFVLVP
jgi:hypothetical protein